MSKFRPATMLIAATPHEKTYHQMALIWGVHPLMVENLQNVDVLVYRCMEEGRKEGIKEGMKAGKAKGETEMRCKIACNLKKTGLPLDVIIQTTGLTAKEIDEL